MFPVRTVIGQALQSLIVLALLLMPAAAASQTAGPLARYDMRVRVQPEVRKLSVDTNVTLPAAATARKSLQFTLLPSMGTPSVRLIAPKAAGALTIRKLREEGDELSPRATWEIEPAKPFPANQPISLQITHSGGDKSARVHYVGPEVVIASGDDQPWYPQFSREKTLGSLNLDMPSGFSAVATGERISDRVKNGRRNIEFRMTWPTKLAFTAGLYKVSTAEQKEGEIPISLYLLRDRDFAADLATVARRSIAVLEKEFGRFPFKEFAVAEISSEAGQKAVFTGASLDGYMMMRTDFLDLRRAEPWFFGHEIGHQWWGASVSRSGEKGLYMLDEALAHYGGLRVVGALRGPEAAKAFRAEQREKTIKLIGSGEDQPLAALPVGSTYYSLSSAKGTHAYVLISEAIGADRLRQFFHGITSANAYSALTWDDYVARMRQAAGPENQWVIDQWFNQKGLPVLDLKWSAGKNEVTIEINQQQPGMPLYRLMKVPVRLAYTDGSAEMRNVDVAAQVQTNTVLPINKAVSRVELDPQHTILWASSQEFATAVALKNATRAWAFWNDARNDEAEKILKAALEARTGPDGTPAEFLERYNYGWLIEEVYNKLPEALDQYKRALQLPVRDETKLVQLYINIARVALAIGDKPQARWAAQSAIALTEARGNEARTKSMKERLQMYLN